MRSKKYKKLLATVIYILVFAILSTYILGIYVPEKNFEGKTTSQS